MNCLCQKNTTGAQDRIYSLVVDCYFKRELILVIEGFIHQVFGHRFAEGQTGAVVAPAFDVGQHRDEELRLRLFRPQDPSVRLAKVLKAI